MRSVEVVVFGLNALAAVHRERSGLDNFDTAAALELAAEKIQGAYTRPQAVCPDNNRPPLMVAVCLAARQPEPTAIDMYRSFLVLGMCRNFAVVDMFGVETLTVARAHIAEPNTVAAHAVMAAHIALKRAALVLVPTLWAFYSQMVILMRLLLRQQKSQPTERWQMQKRAL